jgi:hypothetical protein
MNEIKQIREALRQAISYANHGHAVEIKTIAKWGQALSALDRLEELTKGKNNDTI